MSISQYTQQKKLATEKYILHNSTYKVLEQAKLICGEKSEQWGRKSEDRGEKQLRRDMKERSRVMEKYTTSDKNYAQLCN